MQTGADPKEKHMPAFKRILVATDGSDTSNKALAAAVRLVQDTGGAARLLLVHSVDELLYMSGYEFSPDVADLVRANGEQIVREASAIAQAAGVQPETRLVDQPGVRLGELIAEEARKWDADLVVVGTHGRRGVGRVLLGSGAEQIIRLSPTPVLVVRGD
jgi:nucleotide-binding universal stress UspA family protein